MMGSFECGMQNGECGIKYLKFAISRIHGSFLLTLREKAINVLDIWK
jgi:hypothetical protein